MPSDSAGVPPGMPAIARTRDQLAGGGEAFAADRELAQEIRGVSPESGQLIRAAGQFHAHAAQTAVCDWAKTGIVFAGGGFCAPSRMPHLPVSRCGCGDSTRFLYTTEDFVVSASLRRSLALLRCTRSAVAAVAAADPAAVLREARSAGLGDRVSVQLQFCAARWAPEQAAQVIAGYGKRLGPGSSLVLTWRAFAPGPAGDALMKVVSDAGIPVWRHALDDVAGWLAAAGLDLVAAGDVRVLGGGPQPADGWGDCPAGLMAGAVGVRPAGLPPAGGRGGAAAGR